MRQFLLKIEESEVNETIEQMTAEFFSLSHTDLTVSFERDASKMKSFWIKTFWRSDSNVWEENDFDEVIEHWVDLFFIDFDTIFDALDERCELFDEVTVSKIMTDSNFCFDVAIKISNSNLFERILRSELSLSDFRIANSWCSDSNVRENENIETKEHWFDSFFVDFDTTLNASIERFELVDEVISKVIWLREVVNEICETCRTNVSMTIDLFSISHIDLTVSIERDELLTNFFACCSRTCSRSFFLKLKIWSHLMQIIFEVLILTNETFAKSTRKILIHSFNDVEFMTSCLSYQISKTKSQRQLSNSISRSDFRYKCWHCWKCCKKFAISLNRRFSYVSVESKISIFWSFDVDFAASWIFKAFDLTRVAFLTTLILVFLIAFRFSDEMFNFCCFCEADVIDTADFSMTSLVCSSRNCKTNSYACWFRATHEEYWRLCEFQIS